MEAQAATKQEAEMMGRKLVDTQAARDAALQQLSTLAASVGPQACAAAGIDADASAEGDTIVKGHLERIAELEREVAAAPPLHMRV